MEPTEKEITTREYVMLINDSGEYVKKEDKNKNRLAWAAHRSEALAKSFSEEYNKKLNTSQEDHSLDLQDTRTDYASVDDKNNLIRDKDNGRFSYTKENEKAMNKEILKKTREYLEKSTKIMEVKVKAKLYMVNEADLPEGLDEEVREKFKLIILTKEDKEAVENKTKTDDIAVETDTESKGN